jgi:NAD(P)-dependent dehydrogenase (short-subunit alcohol dehydrogenase family)
LITTSFGFRSTAAEVVAGIDLTGKRAIVTGASSGIGIETARALAGAGAQVTLGVRNTDAGARTAADVAATSGRDDVAVAELDLTRPASVAAFAAAWRGSLDVLVNNAGVMATPETRTKDGFELQIGTNHLGHFALTNLLLPRIGDRVVTVSSTMHRPGKIRLDDLNWERGGYNRWGAYSQSKLANLLFTGELQRKLEAAGSQIRAVAAHPGYAATNLQSHTGSFVQNAFMAIGNRVFAQSDEMGALPTLYAATQDIPGDSYVGPDGFQEQRGHPELVGRSGAAKDRETAQRLWTLSEELTGVTFPLASAKV